MEQSKLSTNTNVSHGYSGEKNETFESNSEGNAWFGSEFDHESNVLDQLKVLITKYDSPDKVEGLFKKLKNFDFTLANKNLLIQICQSLFAAKSSALADQKILIDNLESLYYTAAIVKNFSSWSFEFSGSHSELIANERFFLQLYFDLLRVKNASCLQNYDEESVTMTPFERVYDFKVLDQYKNQHTAIKEKILQLDDKRLLIAIIAMQNVAKSDEVMNIIAMVCGILPQERIEFYSIVNKNNIYVVDHNMKILGTTITTRFTVDKNFFAQVKKLLKGDMIPLIHLTSLLNNRDFIGFENFAMLSNELFDSYLNSLRSY
jgi:hypothetical protein